MEVLSPLKSELTVENDKGYGRLSSRFPIGGIVLYDLGQASRCAGTPEQLSRISYLCPS